MEVKTLTSQGFLELTNRARKGKTSLETNLRLNGLKDVFGDENIGFVLVGDLQKEIRNGKKAPVYSLDSNLSAYEISKGVECDLFLPTSFCFGEGIFPSRGEVDEIVNYLEKMKEEGYIKNIVNSKRGTLSEDKISLLELQIQGINIPPTEHFRDFSDFREFIEGASNTEYVLKHRFGEGGKGMYLIGRQNVEEFSRLPISDYIVQEKMQILNESRLIFFEGELLGSRIIIDRHMPWEEKGKVNRIHLNGKYSPSQDELEKMQKASKFFDASIGCIDFIQVNGNDEKLLLEYNGVGTGWGDYPEIDPYNLNKIVPQKLKDKYLSK